MLTNGHFITFSTASNSLPSHTVQIKIRKLINIHKIFSLPEAKMTMKRDNRRDLVSLIMPIQRQRGEKYRCENYNRGGYIFFVTWKL